MEWIDLVNPEQLQEIKKESEQSPVIIFKHSTTCSISAMALSRMQRNSSAIKEVPGLKVYYLDLRAHRQVSNLVESTFDVTHESPQVLIINKGAAVYHRSHGEIDPNAIRSYLESATS